MADTTVSAAGMRIIKLLVGYPPQTVQDLIDATGVTRTAVTEQLNELAAAGFVERGTERLPGRGRPRYLYNATNTALFLLFARNHQLVVPFLWKAIEDVCGEELKHKMLRKLGRILAESYNRRVTARKPEERLRQLTDILRIEGGLIEISAKNGQLVLYKRSCPFISISDGKQSICNVDQEIMSHVVGRPVRRTASRHDGAPCCTFEIASAKE
ncbi:MAG: MarR family transcriptional regulator [Pirellulales bacterium]|nr:MarR family transcriptional regulator [Pirellulales bacterium]